MNFRFALTIVNIIMLFTTCIGPYELDIEGESGLLVVDGSLIKGVDTQVVIISKTSSISKPEFIPVENCNVKIIDNHGKEFAFDEESPGKYIANIDDAWLNHDKQYKLVFTTSSGDEYESEYQWILETDPVDSIYAIEENHYSSVTETEILNGKQFYIDLDVPEFASRYYRFVLEETWEIQLKNEIWGEYDGISIKPFNRRDSLQHCWLKRDVSGLYSASTVNLSDNRIKKIALHFIKSSSQKLDYKYCATVKQYALNADAYDYWYQKERELNESGNIYTIQPSQPISNIYNINKPDEKVMGFFWASTCAVKHVFVSNNTPRPFEVASCSYISVFCESNDLNEISAALYPSLTLFADWLPDPPIYITVNNNTNYNIALTPACADCRAQGGDARKPEFWE